MLLKAFSLRSQSPHSSKVPQKHSDCIKMCWSYGFKNPQNKKQSNKKKTLCCSYHCCTLHSFGSFFCFNNNKALTFHPSITLSLAGRKSPWIQTKTFKLTALKTFTPVLDSVSSLNVTCLTVVSPKGKHPF